MSVFARRRAERRRAALIPLGEMRHDDRERAITVTLQDSRRVSLSNFKIEVVVEFLREQGYAVDGVRKPPRLIERRIYLSGENEDDCGEEVVALERQVLERAACLAMCGQRDAAHEMIIEEVKMQAGIRL